MRKKYLIGTIFCVCASTIAYAANNLEINESSYPVRVNGIQEEFEKQVYIINDNLYVSCREICEKLGVDIDWDENIKEVNIDTNYKKVLVDKNTEYKEDGVIPDEKTAYAVGKIILGKYAERSLEYETDKRRFYLKVDYNPERNYWEIHQTYEYIDGSQWIGGDMSFPFVNINKNTGEILNIGTYQTVKN